MLNLDTHLLISMAAGRLRPAELVLVERDFLAVSDVVFWEIGILERERRIRPLLDDPDFSRIVRKLTVLPIDLRVAKALSRLDFRSDPADEIIAATSIVHDIPLLTRDARILASKVVPLALPQR